MTDDPRLHKRHELPDALQGASFPDILLRYQKNLMTTTAECAVTICEKSRRIGVTWGIGADAVLTSAASKAAGGMDTLYIGYNLEMAREFIDVCAMWAKNFHHVAAEIEEFVFEDMDGHGSTKEIKAFRINFASGFEICALSSRPRSLRGRQGFIIIDEAAFHDDLPELMKAALAMLIWGGKVLVISTHDGVDNAFNQLIQDAKAGRNKYKLIKIDFDAALTDGLYKRICLVTGKEWTAEAEAAWRQEIVDFYGDGADEELFCIPKKSGGVYMPGTLVESRMTDVPVIRWAVEDDFTYLPEHVRERAAQDWCDDNLRPLLDGLSPDFRSHMGGDFARSGHLSVLWPIQIVQDTTRATPFTVELRNVPFRQQLQITWYILDRLPRFCGAAFDARGNGQQMAEETAQRYGGGLIHEVMTSPSFYNEALPKYKAALEDGMFSLPRDADVLNDHRLAVVAKGSVHIPEAKSKADSGKRHGDSLIAAVMANWASAQDTIEYDYQSVGRPAGDPDRFKTRPEDEDLRDRHSSRFEKGGAW